MAKEPKEIVIGAFNYLKEVSPNTEKITEVRIEELEHNEGMWTVVLSYDVVGDFPFEKERQYKEFKVDDSTGSVMSMKIKKVG